MMKRFGTLLLGVSIAGVSGFVGAGGEACQTDPELFDYGPHRDSPEAEQLAMHLSGQLRAPDAEYDRIRGDLVLIRERYPILEGLVDTPDYEADALLVRPDAELPWTNYEAANVFYQVVATTPVGSSGSVKLRFCDTLNAHVIGPIYEALPEVIFAEPNWTGGDTPEITVTVAGTVYRYEMYEGFGDCPSGCICTRTWVIDVTADGTVWLVSFDEICAWEPTPCCKPDGTCSVMQVGSCLAQGGAPLGVDASCEGDADADGVDAACGDNCPAVFNPDQLDSGDGDGLGDACDNCVWGYNPDQGTAVFPHTIRPRGFCSLAPQLPCSTDQDCLIGACLGYAFEWPLPCSFHHATGTFTDAADIGAYSASVVGPEVATFFVDDSVPAPGTGYWYLVKPDCPGLGSWQSVPGAEPGRDAALP